MDDTIRILVIYDTPAIDRLMLVRQHFVETIKLLRIEDYAAGDNAYPPMVSQLEFLAKSRNIKNVKYDRYDRVIKLSKTNYYE